MKGLLIWAVIVGACFFGIDRCTKSDWYQADERARHEREAAERVPHVIREADGCKVYAFKSGEATHFFTRCGSHVTTDRTYSESCGKN
jgi:hypothetical protein